MRQDRLAMTKPGPLERVARYGEAYRRSGHVLHPTADAEALREVFCQPLPQTPAPAEAVIDALIGAAEPGLVGNTNPNFYAWVMGGSDLVGVSADFLTSVWGQNAAIFQTSPAAAIAEEAVAAWLLELLDLPRTASVGFVTGATMASFVGLAAARSEVLRRAGHDLEAQGFAGAPPVTVFLSDDAHISNHAALRYLGFGTANICEIPSDAAGLLCPRALASEMARRPGPKVVIGQAGHINSGGFEDFIALSDLARDHGAWLHVDGAFGLWARLLPEKSELTCGLDLADSWSVDGHKWLQLPYDSGFAIVRDPEAHTRAMDISAGYLNHAANDGRNPTQYNPELSRRARGFAAWAVIKSLGREGIERLIRTHCAAATTVAARLGELPGLACDMPPALNQLVLRSTDPTGARDGQVTRLAERLNASGNIFVRTALWKGRTVLRLSIVSRDTGDVQAERLVQEIRAAWETLCEGPSSLN